MVIVKSARTSLDDKISPDLEEKIDSLTAGALPYYSHIFKQLASANVQNASMLSEYLSTEIVEENIKLNTRLAQIKIICLFNRHSDYENFQQITKNHVLDYLLAKKNRNTGPDSQMDRHIQHTTNGPQQVFQMVVKPYRTRSPANGVSQ